MNSIKNNIISFLLYILRETRNALKRKYTLWYLLGFFIVCLLGNIAMAAFRSIYGMNDGAFTYNLITFSEGAFVLPYYSCIVLSDIVFGKEYPDPHIKDRFTRTLHRWQLYIGKLFATIIVAVIMFFAAFIMLIGITALFGIGYGTIDKWTILDFLDKATLAFPLWVAGISIGMMLLYSCKGKKTAFIIYFILVLVIPRIIMLLALESIHIKPFVALTNILMTPQFQALQFMHTMNRAKCYALGGIYTLLSTAAGIYMLYKKK